VKTDDDGDLADQARGLAQMLGGLAVEMQSLTDSTAVLEAIASAAVDIVSGASWAGISLVSRRKVASAIQIHDVATRLDRLQTDLGEGPALSALRDRHTVLIDDLGAETRWPSFASTAITLGVHSMLSFRLFVTGESLGVLDLYGAAPHAFSPESVEVGEVLAQHAAVALAGATSAEQLQSAVATRDIIGQAKGILMHRDGLTGLQAFTTLTRASQESNIKLVDVARLFVADHEAAVDAVQRSTKRSR
jgi:GAF domain-containing protein